MSSLLSCTEGQLALPVSTATAIIKSWPATLPALSVAYLWADPRPAPLKCPTSPRFAHCDHRVPDLIVHSLQSSLLLQWHSCTPPQRQVPHAQPQLLVEGCSRAACMQPWSMATLDWLRCSGPLLGRVARGLLHQSATHPLWCPPNPIHSVWPGARPHSSFCPPLQHRAENPPSQLRQPRGGVRRHAGVA